MKRLGSGSAKVWMKETDMANADGVEKLEDAIVRSAEQVAGQIRAAKEAIATVIFGQDRVIENTLVTILSGGHALLIGVPGLAKTKLVETLGITLGLDAKRIQFTPDLMPSDILGAEVLDESNSGKRSFRFISGPVFAQLLMADEINRASPRTQSALLQAMQEQHITVAGARHDLPKPFHVLATQNPLEQEGTYPLPEAQLDRFLMEIDVDYPDRDAERRILFETTGAEETLAKASMNAEILIAAQRLVRRLPVGDSVVEAILSLVRAFHSPSLYATIKGNDVDARSSISMDREGRYSVAELQSLTANSEPTFAILRPRGLAIVDQSHLDSLRLRIQAKAAGEMERIAEDLTSSSQTVEQRSEQELQVQILPRRAEPKQRLQLPITAHEVSAYLTPSKEIPADDKSVADKAREIAGADRDAWSVATKLAKWTFENLKWKRVDYADAAEKRNRRKRRKRRPRILQKRLCSLCYLLFKSVPGNCPRQSSRRRDVRSPHRFATANPSRGGQDARNAALEKTLSRIRAFVRRTNKERNQ